MRRMQLLIVALLVVPGVVPGAAPAQAPGHAAAPGLPVPMRERMEAVRARRSLLGARGELVPTRLDAQAAPHELRRLAGAPRAPVPTMAGRRFATTAPEPWATRDPADSLYRAAREALNRGSYRQAADLFRQLRERYPKSAYAPDAFYWEGFALYRLGGTGDLQAAVRVLREQASRHPNARTREDAEALAVRIQGELARRGDARAAEEVAATASAAVAPAPPTPPARPTPAAPRPPRTAGRTRDRCDDENDTRLAAINALLQMDADRAMPILKKVLARRDEGSVCLRRRAVFLVAQHETPETEQILLGAARQDPDLEVREQAVFWLSEVESERAVAALDSILRTSDEPVLQEKAIFALSQMDLPRAREAVRAYAAREDAPTRVREQAIFWLHENDSPENAQFLRTLFGRLGEPELKEKVLFSLAEMGGEDNLQWLVSVALDERQPVEIRKKALFWAGEGGASIAQLVSLYDRSTDREMKEQLIFVFSQRDERAAADKLVQIARTERDPELRKKALFWLSESDDPRAAEVLTEILEQ